MNRWGVAMTWLLVGGAVSGCGGPQLDTHYASLAPGRSDTSVNGLGAWSELLRQQGHTVRRAGALTPTVFERADCIVWFSHQYSPPSVTVQRWLDAWLSAQPERVLVVVLPDADLEWVYWRKASKRVAPAEKFAVRSEEGRALQRFINRRPSGPGPISWPWFRFDPRPAQRSPQRAADLQGQASWLRGVDEEQVEIYVCGVLLPVKEPQAERFEIDLGEGERLTEALLDEEDFWWQEFLWDIETESVEQFDVLRCRQGMLVLEQRRLDGRVLAVANGSFLLNLGLVNRENRKLAWALAQELRNCETIYFLDAPYGATVREEIPFRFPGFTQLLQQEPVKHLLGHLLLLGVLICCALWPQLGRPQEPATEETTDFGRHVEALAELLAATKESREWAMRRLEQYQQLRDEIGTGVRPMGRTGPPRRASSLLDSG